MGVVGFWRPETRPFTDTERAIMDRFTRLDQHHGARRRREGVDPAPRRPPASHQRGDAGAVRRRSTPHAWCRRSSNGSPSWSTWIASRSPSSRPDSIEAIAGYDRNRVPARIGARWELTPELRAAIDSGEVAFEGFSDVLRHAARHAGTAVGRAPAGDPAAPNRRPRARHPRGEPPHRSAIRDSSTWTTSNRSRSPPRSRSRTPASSPRRRRRSRRRCTRS